MQSRTLRTLFLFALLSFPCSSCATIAGTVVSPVTGAVDMTREFGSQQRWYLLPVYFTVGIVTGPFLGIYNGANHDASIFKSFQRYWKDFSDVFQPVKYARR